MFEQEGAGKKKKDKRGGKGVRDGDGGVNWSYGMDG